MRAFDPAAYGLLVLIGIATGVFLVEVQMRKRAVWPRGLTIGLLCVAMPAAILGAKLAGSLDTQQVLGERPWELLTSAGDCASWGGIVSGGLVMLWILRKRRLPVLEFFDAAASGLLVAYAIGRLACHVTADGCHGVQTSLPWASYVPSSGPEPSQGVHPTALYEASFALLLLPIVLLGADRLHEKSPGTMFGLYLILHWAFRFGIEFIRVNPRHAGLSGAQWASIALVLGGAALLVLAKQRSRASAPTLSRHHGEAFQ